MDWSFRVEITIWSRATHFILSAQNGITHPILIASQLCVVYKSIRFDFTFISLVQKKKRTLLKIDLFSNSWYKFQNLPAAKRALYNCVKSYKKKNWQNVHHRIELHWMNGEHGTLYYLFALERHTMRFQLSIDATNFSIARKPEQAQMFVKENAVIKSLYKRDWIG